MDSISPPVCCLYPSHDWHCVLASIVNGSHGANGNIAQFPSSYLPVTPVAYSNYLDHWFTLEASVFLVQILASLSLCTDWYIFATSIHYFPFCVWRESRITLKVVWPSFWALRFPCRAGDLWRVTPLMENASPRSGPMYRATKQKEKPLCYLQSWLTCKMSPLCWCFEQYIMRVIGIE